MERRTGSSRINGLSLSALPGPGSNSYFCLFVFLYFCLFVILSFLQMDSAYPLSAGPGPNTYSVISVIIIIITRKKYIIFEICYGLLNCVFVPMFKLMRSNYKSVGFSTQYTISFQPKAKSCLRYFPPDLTWRALKMDTPGFINSYGRRKNRRKLEK